MNAGSSEFAHYGDCTRRDVDRLARPGRWSAAHAVGVLRHVLTRNALALEPAEEEIMEWTRRDVPELRSATDRTTPEALYERIASSARGETMFRSGRSGAIHMGYGAELDTIEQWKVDRFVGLGCPWPRGLPQRGHNVLDLGCGAGVDLAIAHAAVGPSGFAVGIDRLASLASLASAAGRRSGAVALASAVTCPVRSGWADVVVANGLPPLLGARSAPSVLAEVNRVLRPDGVLRFTALVVGPDREMDELADVEVVDAVRCSKPMCAQYRNALRIAGYADVTIDDAPSPFVPGYRAGPVRAVLVSGRRA